jgi:hypothetical protein
LGAAFSGVPSVIVVIYLMVAPRSGAFENL